MSKIHSKIQVLSTLKNNERLYFPFPSYQEQIFKYAPSTFIMAFMSKSNSLLSAEVKLNTDSYWL